jgi:hypothetical protein
MDGNRSIICGAQFNIKMKIEGRPSPCSGNLQHRHFVKQHRNGAGRLTDEDVWQRWCGNARGVVHRKS